MNFINFIFKNFGHSSTLINYSEGSLNLWKVIIKFISKVIIDFVQTILDIEMLPLFMGLIIIS
jgi:hypothetical protein